MPVLWKVPPAPEVTRIFLARHGATAANEMIPFILQGSELDGPLTSTGEQQAAALGAALQGIELAAAYCSTLQRARQTTAIALGERPLQAVALRELRECSVGNWEGLSWETIQERDAENYRLFFEDAVNRPHPGGESYRDVLVRAEPVLRTIARNHVGQNVLVVAHNLLNRVLLAKFLDVDLQHARRLKQANCCLNWLEVTGDQVTVITLNSVWHLGEITRH